MVVADSIIFLTHGISKPAPPGLTMQVRPTTGTEHFTHPLQRGIPYFARAALKNGKTIASHKYQSAQRPRPQINP